MPWVAPYQPTELVARLFLILRNLRDGLAIRGAKEHATGPLVLLICKRLTRMYARVENLVAAIREGRLPTPPAQRPRSRREPRPPKALHLPRGFGWMLRMAPETRQTGGQVQFWMADPELAELVAKAPQLGRTLRWLCQAMQIEPPPALRLPPRPRPRRTRKPQQIGAAQERS
jgi:hypothetical protein